MTGSLAKRIGSLAKWIRTTPIVRWVLIAAAAAMLIALIVYVVPPLLANGTFDKDPQRLKAENDVRGTLLQALAGAFLLLGLYFTARTLQLNREGQITERFTRAIDQLGNEALEVRLGGIYALERIAIDSERDRETIFEVLSTYIREDSRRRIDPGVLPRSYTDAEAAVRVLGRRKHLSRDRALNLRGAFLAGFDLSHADLRYADLRHANLEEADLVYADLTAANLQRANLEKAKLVYANVTHTDFRDAKISKEALTFTRGVEDAVGLEDIRRTGPEGTLGT